MADVEAHSLETILTRDAALLKDSVREAGSLAHAMFRTELKKWIKGASSPVSEADIAVNDLLEARLRSATPDYGWLSEESADDEARLSRRLTWVVDPIDGTRNYLNGHDEWCVSVALVEDASPVLAAVYAPSSDEFFFAARDQGTTLNGVPVRAAGGSALDFARVAGPKPLVERLKPSLGDIKLHPRIGSLALRLCRVAHGALDAAFAGGNSHDWDLAAADLIVQEADGRMSGLSGDPILYNRREVAHGVLVAAGRDRHASIVAHFRDRPFA
ncbi:3'(2'),5'-bisphosphate nucleotidase CysQ [Bradyrhizobium diazoefficiens]|uniref:3'(2'),5'-bisphosphate nucleotidase CysQ n=1 Tax=Bradyrhizobium diazoefficiens TaxID=1355477 RepID=UPI00190DDBA2|nr:3'(2'),5'-bisphosphate nucleotidase CysQ [Bradyrhizobium diazoefficiens]QQO15809.1 3'(2'),5'-bisphosphate nucleotidase CysQ [Bradyrhizobium diazoefficiens]